MRIYRNYLAKALLVHFKYALIIELFSFGIIIDDEIPFNDVEFTFIEDEDTEVGIWVWVSKEDV